MRELLDERSSEIQAERFLPKKKLEGHFRGRKAGFYLNEASSWSQFFSPQIPWPEFQIALSCNFFFFFEVERGRGIREVIRAHFDYRPPLGRKLKIGDPDLDRKFRFYYGSRRGLSAIGRLIRRLLRRYCGPDGYTRDQQVDDSLQFIEWVKRPEVRDCLQLLLAPHHAHRLGFRIGALGDSALEVTYGPYRKKHLALAMCRTACGNLETLAQSLEKAFRDAKLGGSSLHSSTSSLNYPPPTVNGRS